MKSYQNEQNESLQQLSIYASNLGDFYKNVNFQEGSTRSYYVVLRRLDDDLRKRYGTWNGSGDVIVECVPWDERTPFLKEVLARQFDGEKIWGDLAMGNQKMLGYYKSLAMVNCLAIYNNGDPVLSHGLGSDRDNTISNVLAGIEAYYPGTLPGGMCAWYYWLTSKDNAERVHAVLELSDIVYMLADSNGPRKPRAWLHHMCDATGRWLVSDEA